MTIFTFFDKDIQKLRQCLFFRGKFYKPRKLSQDVVQFKIDMSLTANRWEVYVKHYDPVELTQSDTDNIMEYFINNDVYVNNEIQLAIDDYLRLKKRISIIDHIRSF